MLPALILVGLVVLCLFTGNAMWRWWRGLDFLRELRRKPRDD
jgi:hypothetical protein